MALLTLRTHANLGRTLLRQQRLDEAETVLLSAWTAQASQRGKSHSDTLSTQRLLTHCRALVARNAGTSFVSTREKTVPSREEQKTPGSSQEIASQK